MKYSVLFVQKNPHKKGSQYSLFRLMREFIRDDQNPVLLSSEEGWLTETARQEDIDVIVEKFPGSRSLLARLWLNRRFAKKIKNILKQEKIDVDVVIGNDHSEGLITWWVAEEAEVPRIAVMRQPYMSERGFRKYACGEMNGLVVINNWMQEKISGWVQNGRETFFIENGLLKEEFYPPEEKSEKFPDKILVPGSTEPRKGWEDFFQALLIVKETSPDFPDTEFHFTGEEPDFYSEYKEELEKSQFKLKFIGHHDEFQELMRQYSLIVEPTRSETFGMLGLEAVAAGVPTVSTDTGNIVNIVDQDFIVSTEEPKELANKLIELSKKWDKIEIPMSQYQKKLRDKYSIKRTYKGYKQMIEELM